DEHRLAAPDNVEISVCHARQITRLEPAFGIDRLRGFLQCAVIALHDARTANPQFADSIAPDVLARSAYQPRLDSGKRRSDAAIRTVQIDAGERDGGRTFGNAVTVAERQTEKR